MPAILWYYVMCVGVCVCVRVRVCMLEPSYRTGDFCDALKERRSEVGLPLIKCLLRRVQLR